MSQEFIKDYFSDYSQKCKKIKEFLKGKTGVIECNVFEHQLSSSGKNYKGYEFTIKGILMDMQCYPYCEPIQILFDIKCKRGMKEYHWYHDVERVNNTLYEELVEFLKNEK